MQQGRSTLAAVLCLGLVDPETPVLAALALEGLIGHAYLAGGLSDCANLGYRHLGLSQLVDHLLRRMSLLRHLSPFLRPNNIIIPGPVLGAQDGGQVKLLWGGSSAPVLVVCTPHKPDSSSWLLWWRWQ